MWGPPHFKEIKDKELGELAKLKCSYAMERHIKEERSMEKVGQMLESILSPVSMVTGCEEQIVDGGLLVTWDHGNFRIRLLPGVMCGSLVLQ